MIPSPQLATQAVPGVVQVKPGSRLQIALQPSFELGFRSSHSSPASALM